MRLLWQRRNKRSKVGKDMAITFQQLIDQFIEGAREGYSGTAKTPGNLKIQGDQLIHYSTPILERHGDKYIFNVTRYSIQTGQLQKKIKVSLTGNSIIEVKRVPPDTKMSLKEYMRE